MRAPLENPVANNLLDKEELWTWTEIKSEISAFIRKKYFVSCKNLAVIDLTGSDVDAEKYYKGSTLYDKHGVVYNKVLVRGTLGSKVPDESLFDLFNQIANVMLKSAESDAAERRVKCSGNHSFYTDCEVCDDEPNIQILLVHCLHGLNRTGLFICNFLITQCGMDPETAINFFEEARGYPMKYDFYKNHIRSLVSKSKISDHV